jgi:hypothetical protein
MRNWGIVALAAALGGFASTSLAIADPQPALPGPGNISAPYKPPQSDAPLKESAPASSTTPPKAAVPADDPIEFKIVDAADLFVGTRKYFGKDILLPKMHCYYADVDDYRCIAPGATMLAVFTAAIEPRPAKDWVEKNCDQLKTAVASDKCRFNVRFRYDADDIEDDIVSGYQKRRVIRPPNGVTMIPTRALSKKGS